MNCIRITAGALFSNICGGYHGPETKATETTDFNNVVITSHQAFLTRQALNNIADTTLENVREFELGKRLVQLTNRVASTVRHSYLR